MEAKLQRQTRQEEGRGREKIHCKVYDAGCCNVQIPHHLTGAKDILAALRSPAVTSLVPPIRGSSPGAASVSLPVESTLPLGAATLPGATGALHAASTGLPGAPALFPGAAAALPAAAASLPRTPASLPAAGIEADIVMKAMQRVQGMFAGTFPTASLPNLATTNGATSLLPSLPGGLGLLNGVHDHRPWSHALNGNVAGLQRPAGRQQKASNVTNVPVSWLSCDSMM